MSVNANIYALHAREILDSRGNPTVETTAILESGYRGTAAVPSGASVGKYEALELRDNDKRYDGLGVAKAVNNVNTILNKALHGLDAFSQGVIDKKMVELDGTPNKTKLGANAILSVSVAVAVAAANQTKQPLYTYLQRMYAPNATAPPKRMPIPIFNLINGGKHGAGNLDFQEFQIIPATNKSYHESLEIGTTLYRMVKNTLVYRGAVHSVGDEGGFAPNLFTNAEALEILTESMKTTAYRPGADVFFGLDVAASYFHKDNRYRIKDRAIPYTPDDFITYFRELNGKYKLLLLEDPFQEDDWESWTKITMQLGSDILIVGDDLLATNRERLEKAIALKACSAILMKPNQIGTLSEFLAVAVLARTHDFKIIVSHRSGETNDAYIADLAVAIGADYVKFGAPARGERVAKYNRLSVIERELTP